MFGGAMRQVGILAAAGLYALDHHFARLPDDHTNAKVIADRLATCAHAVLDERTVQTNIVIFSLAPGAPDAAAVVAAARAHGVLIVAFGPRIVRAVTHLDVTREQCEHAAEVILDVIK
jgi:threonine aldolase